MTRDKDDPKDSSSSSGSSKGSLREVTGEGEPKYKYEDFIVPASDTKGHSDRLTFRCKGGHLRKASEFIHTRKFPYKTPSDLFRHALYRHLQWLAFLEPTIKTHLGIMEATVEIARTQQILLQFKNTIEEVRETVEQLESVGMRGQARKLIFDIKKMIDAETSDDVWREKLEEELQTRYGHLLKEGSSLKNFGDDK